MQSSLYTILQSIYYTNILVIVCILKIAWRLLFLLWWRWVGGEEAQGAQFLGGEGGGGVNDNFNHLSANPIKWPNTPKQFAGTSRWIVWVFDHFVGLVFKGLIHTQYAIIEIYHRTLRPRDFPYLSICFIAICKIWHVLLKCFGIVWEVNIFDFCCVIIGLVFFCYIYI